MATARPPTSATRVASATTTEEQTAAEHAFYRVVDGARDDLCVLRERWPDRTAPECLEALARLQQRAAPAGDAEAAMAGIFDAYGGPLLVPQRVRQRLERYAWDQLGGGGPSWPQPDPAEDLEEPAIVRKARRSRRSRGTRASGQSGGGAVR